MLLRVCVRPCGARACAYVHVCVCRSYMAVHEMWPICGCAAVIPSTWGSWRVKEGESSLTTRRGFDFVWKCSQKVADGDTFEWDWSGLTFSIKKALSVSPLEPSGLKLLKGPWQRLLMLHDLQWTYTYSSGSPKDAHRCGFGKWLEIKYFTQWIVLPALWLCGGMQEDAFQL